MLSAGLGGSQRNVPASSAEASETGILVTQGHAGFMGRGRLYSLASFSQRSLHSGQTGYFSGFFDGVHFLPQSA